MSSRFWSSAVSGIHSWLLHVGLGGLGTDVSTSRKRSCFMGMHKGWKKNGVISA
mgnify:CR=1 FL=1